MNGPGAEDEGTSIGPNGERIFFSMQAKMHNEKAVDLIRTYQTIVGGCCAGVLGLTGLAGAVLYIVIYLAISILLLAMMGFNSKGYMNVSPLKFCIEGGMGGGKYGLSYVLFWTLSYALIYIY